MRDLPELFVLWSHALAALLFSALALWAWHGARRDAVQTSAFAATALWALAVAGIGQNVGVTSSVEAIRNLALLAFAWRIAPYSSGNATRRSALLFHATIAIVFLLGGAVASTAANTADLSIARMLNGISLMLRLLATVAALVLVHGAHVRATTMSARTAALAIAAIWLVDANLLTLAWATGEWPQAMLTTRGLVLVGVAGVFGANLQRDGERPVQFSRTVAVQSLSLLAVLSYLAIFASVTEGIEALAGRQARIWQTAFVFGSTAAALAILSQPKLRAWLRVKAAKHLFRHRYDYRTEWMRFTRTLSRRDDTTRLDERTLRAVADLLDAPAAILLMCEGNALVVAAHWRWSEASMPGHVDDGTLARHLAATGRIIELDAVRMGKAPIDADAISAQLLDMQDAWSIVPLPHPSGLIGAIVLARPPIARSFDWEDFDLLKLAGLQAASALAEYRAQTRLVDAERFEEFNRRFAFILHDIKNLISQLSLLARNAERHADNPAFRADMILTLNESAARMNELVKRLSHARGPRTEEPRPVAIMPIVAALAAERQSIHPITVSGDDGALAKADAAAVEQILRHLIQNAAEASLPSEPVAVAVAMADERVVIDVTDRGCGMSAAFIREQLFRPFISTKAGGFGIGAYEARALAISMGGTIEVYSREGEGSRFRVTLPAAPTNRMEHAA